MNNPFSECRIVANGPEASERYREEPHPRGSADFTMTQGHLVKIDHCPRRWVRGYATPESDSTEWGSMVDCLLLTPEAFHAAYAITPRTYTDKDGNEKPWRDDDRMQVVKDWKAANAGKRPLKPDLFTQLQSAVGRLNEDEEILDLLSSGKRQVWVAGVYCDPITRIRVPVKGLIDIAPDNTAWAWRKCLADLKTTRAAHPDRWAKWVHQQKYHVQAAFYLDLWNAATGEQRTEWRHVLQENFPPFEPGKRVLDPQFIEAGRALYLRALTSYCRALGSGEWIGYDDAPSKSWTLTRPDPWMLTDEIMNNGSGGSPGDDLDDIAPGESEDQAPQQAEAA